MDEQNVEHVHVFPDSNRIGMMDITHEVLHNGANREMLQALFGLCIVISTEPHESGRGVRYVASSELFEPLSDGAEIPEYRVTFQRNQPFAEPDHEARKVLSTNGFAFVAIKKIIVRVPPAQIDLIPRRPGTKPLH